MYLAIPCIVLKIIQGIVKNMTGKFAAYMVLLEEDEREICSNSGNCGEKSFSMHS